MLFKYSKQYCFACLFVICNICLFATSAFAYPPSRPTPVLQGTIRACAAYQKKDNTWTDSFKVWITYTDGAFLKHALRGNFKEDEGYLVITYYNDYPTIINLGMRSLSLSTVPSNYQDLEGYQWKISRTWRACRNSEQYR